ncbi:MAG TPA: hypothetical protein PK880_09795 [Candidatus Competibacter sp.]|nr:hypothetical protein [Candidatus Competibacteraceae bacterium]HRC72815.1 hypothetical protein [Candidatus Competibacter sp.]
MKKSSFLLAGSALLLSQSAAVVVAAGFTEHFTLKQNERYGCCIVKTLNKAADVWEYEDDVSFGTCYKWARLTGDPLQFLNNRKYEFYENTKCATFNGEHELVREKWSPTHRSGY